MRLGRSLFNLVALTLFSVSPGFSSDLALTHAKIYPTPTEAAIEDGTILIHEGHIAAVGPSTRIRVAKGTTVIDCKGRIVTASFWNSHVHILTPRLLHAETLTAEQITSQLTEMFTRWGFTTVFDIASIEQNTTLIRRRIEAGEVKGPRILTVGEPFWVKGGTPIYVRGFLKENHISIPDVESTQQATARVDQQIRDGADGIKIFANSIEEHDILTMPLDLAQAIVAAAHRSGKPVFAHVSNDQGIEVALQSGADILAHTTPNGDPWSPRFARRLVSAHMALTPTLTLWDVEAKKGKASAGDIEQWMSRAADQLKAFAQAGGQVLFGTDIGYIEQYDTSEEIAWMSRAGMGYQQILASLTTNPAARFGDTRHSGHIASGMDADLVVLDSDPEKDITAFSAVRLVVRRGRIVYSVR